RCDNRLPEIDENGRFLARECFNINPGAFHLTLVNQIGRAKRAFVMDSVSSAEVWNYPVVGYSFKYFNPETLEEVEKMENGIIPFEDFTKDKFRKYRSKKVAKILGVQADITFLKDRIATFKDVETDKHNQPGLVIYRYDLELDKEGKVIGGEWYHGHHPDFLWVTQAGTKAKGPYDDEIKGTWNPEKELVPKSWADVAIKSSLYGEVAAPIVEALFKLSHKGVDGINPNQKD
ncbi:MAG: peptidase, partial [Deltaproteobacteria bacterium]